MHRGKVFVGQAKGGYLVSTSDRGISNSLPLSPSSVHSTTKTDRRDDLPLHPRRIPMIFSATYL